MNIINKELIIKNFISYDGVENYILKYDTKLNQVFDSLPSGILNKNITGIGATTLEIESPRNSIIVVPLKSIAGSKAKQHPFCKYVGGKTENFKLTSKDDINNYLNKKNIPNKKFLVVADSLPKLLTVLGDEAYNYFIMIDEIDSFQLDSGYRDSLEDCLDYYKTFPKNQRALVSSTIMEFSDPELNGEKRYFFNYENGNPRKINIYYSENVKGAAFDFIEDLYNKHPDDKILIAYNTVDGCKAIATKLVEEFNVPYEEIKILCSPKRKGDVHLFYDELENGILKGKINFMTSAYFVGVDIIESYHSVVICNPDILHTLLSTNRLKQIAGRCREKALLSETIFYSTTNYSPDEQIPKERLFEASRNKIQAIECIGKNFAHDQVLAKQILDVRKLIIEKDDVIGYSLVRTNIKGELVHAYFNIDACIDTMNTAKVLYSDQYALEHFLKIEFNKVEYNTVDSSTKVLLKVPIDKEAQQEQLNIAIDAIRNINNPRHIVTLINNSRSAFQTKFYQRYHELCNDFEDKEMLIKYLVDFAFKNETAYKNLKNTIKFKNDNSLLKRCVLEEFPIGSVHNSKEIKQKLNNAFALASMHEVINTETNAVKKLNQFFKTSKNKRKLKEGLPTHKIIGLHDLEIKNSSLKNKKQINLTIADEA